MPYLKKISIVAVLFFTVLACSNTDDTAWREIVSPETSFIIVPNQDATVDSVLKSPYTPVLDDVTSSSIQLISKIDSTATTSLTVQSLFLYPGTNQKLQPVWIFGKEDDLYETLKERYAREFMQNEYRFHGSSILDLDIENRRIFLAEINDMLLVSESSLGIEQSIRTYRGLDPVVDLSELDIQPGSIIINTPMLDHWIAQLGSVAYNPSIQKAFAGTQPAILNIDQPDSTENIQIHLAGNIGLSGEEKSPLIRAIASPAQPITLDEYISSNAAGFGIFHVATPDEPNTAIPDTTSVDASLMNDSETYTEMANLLNSELGLVMYTKSGFLSTGEYVLIRKVNDTKALRSLLDDLSTRNLIEKVEDAYFIQSSLINQIIGAGMSNFRDFYVKIVGDAAIISKRKGLADMVASDRERRRVITYEEFYKKIEENLPENISSLFVAGPDFYSFLEPFLADDNYVDALTSNYNYITLTTQLNDAKDAFSFNMSGFNVNGQDEPFTQNWSYSTGGAELSGHPVFGNMGGSFDNEVVFATKSGRVYVLAADGSFVQRYNTGSDVPVGSPIVYDWYGTGENVVLLAAGNKIYGWDENGNTLPKFPFELSEQITTPLRIVDLNDNKLPDAIVATANRKLHVLNGRGNELPGWPVTTNAGIRSAPRIDYYNDQPAVIAFSANAVHAWKANGSPLPDFPIFAGANLKGSPEIYDDHIFANSVDGNLYSMGDNTSFSDSLEVSGPSQNVSAIYVSSGSLSGSPSVVKINNPEEAMILTASASGSVFLLSPEGKLNFTKSMGQPIADASSPLLTDINSDGSSDIVALANYGRLYAWNIRNGERIFNLPTASISHMNLTDLDGDGLKELIAQTEDGIQSWTINRP